MGRWYIRMVTPAVLCAVLGKLKKATKRPSQTQYLSQWAISAYHNKYDNLFAIGIDKIAFNACYCYGEIIIQSAFIRVIPKPTCLPLTRYARDVLMDVLAGALRYLAQLSQLFAPKTRDKNKWDNRDWQSNIVKAVRFPGLCGTRRQGREETIADYTYHFTPVVFTLCCV